MDREYIVALSIIKSFQIINAMIEVYLIKGNDTHKVATINHVNTNYSHCSEIVLAIGKTVYIDGIVFSRVKDNEYPICFKINNDSKFKIGAKDIK